MKILTSSSPNLQSRILSGLTALSAALFASGAPAVGDPDDPRTQLPTAADVTLEFSTPLLPGENQATSSDTAPDVINLNRFLGAERFYDAGYTGTRAILANIEAGVVWDGHQDFNTPGHVNYMTPVGGALTTASSIELHATGVAAMMSSRGDPLQPYPTDPHRWGISHGAEFWTGGIATFWPQLPFYFTGFVPTPHSIALTYEQALRTGMGASQVTADVLNGSWGAYNPNDYISTLLFYPATVMDTLASESRSLLVFAAGNAGPGTTVGNPALGYNTLAVGALQGPDFDQLAGFSSRGPTFSIYFDEEISELVFASRVGVDLVAPGTNAVIPYYGGQSGGNQTGSDLGGWTPAADDLYTTLNGTSFAAPLVAGGAALLVDAGRDVFSTNPEAIDALVLKAVLLNSADKLPGWSNAQTEVAQAGGRFGTDTILQTTQSLDHNFGAGRMNLDRAFDQFMPGSSGGLATTTNVASNITGDLGFVGAVGWDFASFDAPESSNFYFIEGPLLGGSTFSGTLTWFADRGYAFVDGDSGPSLQTFELRMADLNLSLFTYDPDTMNILGTVAESSSFLSPVEHLWFDLLETGFYGIQIDYSRDIWNFYDQPRPVEYGLAWSSGLFAIPEPGRATLMLASIALILFRRRRPDGFRP